MELLPKDSYGCPALLLAPMEGVGDLSFRRAMASIGGFNEACTEFLRVPLNGHIPSLAKRYDPNETLPIPQAVQLMGSSPELMAAMTREVVKLGAHRVDLNCGCPSNTVTGRGAGSSLLKDPNQLFEVAKAMCNAVNVPITAKLRIGFEDASLFKENLMAAQESGVRFITLHARTKVDGYGPPARIEYITAAKKILKIPLVGNGDILTVEDAIKMLETTHCDALMIGRGAVTNPFIFQEIRSYFSKKPFKRSFEKMKRFLEIFMENLPPEMPVRNQINKLKQLIGFLFKGNDVLLEKRQTLLRSPDLDAKMFCLEILQILQEYGNFE
jgi:tRNA-dihydrouridine synthase C